VLPDAPYRAGQGEGLRKFQWKSLHAEDPPLQVLAMIAVEWMFQPEMMFLLFLPHKQNIQKAGTKVNCPVSKVAEENT